MVIATQHSVLVFRTPRLVPLWTQGRHIQIRSMILALSQFLSLQLTFVAQSHYETTLQDFK
jgi:hypothetical protein